MKNIISKFLEYNYDYRMSEENVVKIFRNKSIEFKFINQRFDGWELYFSNEDTKNIKLDFILEIFASSRNLSDVVKERFEKSNKKDLLNYYYILIFEKCSFLVENNRTKTDEFLIWHKENSSEFYEEYKKRNSSK